MSYAVGSGLKAAAALNTPSCYVQTGGTGTSMTGAGHYKVTVGGDPDKAGLTVNDVAKKRHSSVVFTANGLRWTTF